MTPTINLTMNPTFRADFAAAIGESIFFGVLVFSFAATLPCPAQIRKLSQAEAVRADSSPGKKNCHRKRRSDPELLPDVMKMEIDRLYVNSKAVRNCRPFGVTKDQPDDLLFSFCQVH